MKEKIKELFKNGWIGLVVALHFSNFAKTCQQ